MRVREPPTYNRRPCTASARRSQQSYGTDRTLTFQLCALPVRASTLATAMRGRLPAPREVAGYEDAVAVRGDGVCLGDVDVGGHWAVRVERLQRAGVEVDGRKGVAPSAGGCPTLCV
jgi:hypothetical protein